MVALLRSEVAGANANDEAPREETRDARVSPGTSRTSTPHDSKRKSGEWVCAGSASPSWSGRVVGLAKGRPR